MSLFICPLCQSPLQLATNSWYCDASLNLKQTVHTFDVARQGYVNLFPVQQKRSKAPGDSQASIEARQRFLTAGYYQPLQALIGQQVEQLVVAKQATVEAERKKGNKQKQVNWLDIGCGEGYYTQAIAQVAEGIMSTLVAADISKSAVLELAKASKAINNLWYQQRNTDADIDLNEESKDEPKNQQPQVRQQQPQKKTAVYPIVTSAAHLPLQAQSLRGISSIFSPILPEAFAKVLQSDGYLIIAKPDSGHLATVRAALFDEVRAHNSDKFLVELAPYFTLLETHYVGTELRLAAAAMEDLLTMTPYAYRAHAKKRQALVKIANSQPFQTEAKFVVYVLQKTAATTQAP